MKRKTAICYVASLCAAIHGYIVSILESIVAMISATFRSMILYRRMPRLLLCCFAVSGHLLLSGLCSSVAVAASVQQPERSIGYFIGDILVQRIALDSLDGTIINDDMDTGQRVDEYLYRLPVLQVLEQPSAPSWIGHLLDRARQAWTAIYKGEISADTSIDLRYQVINAPPVTTQISLPEMTLTTTEGATIEVPAWRFGVSPLLPGPLKQARVDGAVSNDGKSNALQLMPDQPASSLLSAADKRKLQSRLAALLLLLLATVLLWLAWWLFRQYRDRHVLPFARARYAIKNLPRSQRENDDGPWRELHSAFNATAGKTIASGAVGDLLQRAPWLKTQAAEINEFYVASSERFFQESSAPGRVNIESLSDSLYKLEKSQSPSQLAPIESPGAGAATGKLAGSAIQPLQRAE